MELQPLAAGVGRPQSGLDYIILNLLSSSPSPLGASVLVNLVGRNYHTSEASIGRKLRELDYKGYTRKIGCRGRAITEKGMAHLRDLANNLRQTQEANALLHALEEARNRELLMEVLEARVLLEEEVARHAAINATEEELVRLRTLIDRQRQASQHGSAAAEDVDFHNVLAEASRKRILRHALALIRFESELSQHVAYMRKQVSGRLVCDHEAIFAAVARKDPEGAALAMREHITGVMQDVKEYLARRGQPGAAGDPAQE